MDKYKKMPIIFIIVLLIVIVFFSVKTYIIKKSTVEQCKCNCNEKVEFKINQQCVSSKLGGVIADVENDIHYLDARELTNGKVENWIIVKNSKVGAYAIIESKDAIAIEDLKKYFNSISPNYQFKNIIGDWYVLLSSSDNYNFDELNDCIK